MRVGLTAVTAIAAAAQKFYQDGKQPDGSALPWPKDVYDKLQAIK